MSQFLTDTFTGTDGTDLNAHTGETGATWTRHPTWPSNAGKLATNRATNNASGVNVVYYASGVPASAEYDVSALIQIHLVTSNTRIVGVWARLSTTVETGYLARAFLPNNGSNSVTLFEAIAGTYTQLATVAIANLTIDTDYTLELRCRDGVKTVWWNGTQVLTDSTNNVTAAGRAGVYFFDSGGTSNPAYINSIGATDAPVTPTRTAADTVTLTDTAFNRSRKIADTVTITDAITASRSKGRLADETVTVADSVTVSTTQGTLTTPVALGPGVFLFGSQVANWRNPADTVTITDSATRIVARPRTAADSVTLSDTVSQSLLISTVAKVRFSTTVTGTKTAIGAHDEVGAVPPFTVQVPGVLERVRFTVLSRASSTSVRFAVTVAGQKGTRAPATATLKLSTVQAGIKTGPGTTSAAVRLAVQVTGIKSVTSPAAVSVRFTTTATGTASIVHAGASTATVHLAANATGTKIGKTAAQAAVRFSTQATGIATPPVLGTSASLVHLNATAAGRKTAAGATTTTVAVASVVAGGRRTGGDADETVRFAEFATGRQGTTGQWPGAHRGRIQRPNHGRVR